MKNLIFTCWAFLSIKETFFQKCQHVRKFYSKGRGRFKIAGIFPVRNDDPVKFNIDSVMSSIAFAYTINQAGKILNKTNLPEYVGYDSCSYDNRDLLTDSILDVILSNQTVLSYPKQPFSSTCSCGRYKFEDSLIGVVGLPLSTNSKYVSKLLSINQIPIISYLATSVELSNKDEYPNFLRTVLPDKFQARLIVDILLYYNWSYVSIVATDESYGRLGKKELHKQFKVYNICVQVDELLAIPQQKQKSMKVINKLKEDKLAKVVIVWSLNLQVQHFLNYALKEQLTDKIWIFTESVGHEDWFLKYQSVVGKSIFVTTFSGSNEDFLNYFWSLNLKDGDIYPWLKTLFKMRNITENNVTLSTFKGDFDFSVVGYVRNAVLALLYALKEYMNDYEVCSNITTCKLPRSFNHLLFIENYIKKVQFKGVHDHTVAFDANGDITSGVFHLHVINVSKNGTTTFIRIGEWHSDDGLIIRTEYTAVHGLVKSQCSTICNAGYYSLIHLSKPCCWVCFPCPSGYFKPHKGHSKCQPCPSYTISNKDRTMCSKLNRIPFHKRSKTAITIYVLTTVCVSLCLFTIIMLLKYKNTPIVRSSNFRLSLMQTTAILVLHFSTILYVFKDNVHICRARIFVSSITLSLIISVTVVKTTSLLKVFLNPVRLEVKDVKRIKTSGYVTVILLSIFLCLIHVAVLNKLPISIHIQVNDFENTFGEYCNNMEIHYLIQVVYVITLQLASGVQAFRARNLPGTYHEAAYISFAMFSSALVLILVIPIVRSIAEVNVRYAVFSLMMLFANTLILLILYGNKIYSILVHSKLNNKKHFPRPVVSLDIKDKNISDAAITHKYISGEMALVRKQDSQQIRLSEI